MPSEMFMKSILKEAWRLSRKTFLLAVLFLHSAVPASAERIAIIVHPSNTEVISARDIYLIYMGRKTNWADGTKIIPLDHTTSEWKEVFLRQFLNMNAYQYEEYWLERSIRGEGKEPGKKTTAVVKRLVSKIAGAIGYIPESMVDDTVRVVFLQ